MRILYPSGLYKDKIPRNLTESGSITWTISTEAPSRPETTLQQYPIARQLDELAPSELDIKTFRKLYGELLTTVTSSSTSSGLSNAIRFEVGKILNNSDLEAITRQELLSPKFVQIDHDNNIYDLESLGLTEEEAQSLGNETLERIDEIRNNINAKNIELDKVRNSVFENSKKVSDTQNALAAASLTTLTDIIEKLESSLEELNETAVELAEQQTSLEQEVLDLYDQLLDISTLVR